MTYRYEASQIDATTLTCRHKLVGGFCEASIVRDQESYSGFRHERITDDAGQHIDWLHWAAPVETAAPEIFVPCAVCGKCGPDNEAHICFDGHKFIAQLAIEGIMGVRRPAPARRERSKGK